MRKEGGGGHCSSGISRTVRFGAGEVGAWSLLGAQSVLSS